MAVRRAAAQVQTSSLCPQPPATATSRHRLADTNLVITKLTVLIQLCLLLQSMVLVFLRERTMYYTLALTARLTLRLLTALKSLGEMLKMAYSLIYLSLQNDME